MYAISIPLLPYTTIGGSCAKKKKWVKGEKNTLIIRAWKFGELLTSPLPSVGSVQMLLAHEDVSLASVPSLFLTKTLLFYDVKGTQ